jgi:uncharacterized protein YeaO (DUF488 family)
MLERFGMTRIKRIYDEADESDDFRILVDRLWPRGLSKDRVKVDLWLKDIAPSDRLRKWFAHDPKRWAEFKSRYFEELEDKKEMVNLIIEKTRSKAVILLYGAKDKEHNNAIALKEYIAAKVGRVE